MIKEVLHLNNQWLVFSVMYVTLLAVCIGFACYAVL